MITGEVKVPASLENVQMRIGQAMLRGVQQASFFLTNAAQGNAPRVYGTLKRSIIVGEVRPMGSGFQGKVIQDAGVAKYGPYVEEGTGIYGEHKKPIVPVKAKALSWTNKGKRITVKSVKGMKGRFYMKRTAKENIDEVKNIMMKSIGMELNR